LIFLEAKPMTEMPIDLPNACQPEANLLTGGQPSRACLKAARDAGYHTVVNLRPPGEFEEFDEAQAVHELGMSYACIPIAGPPDLTPAAAEALDEMMNKAGDRPVLVHCASGNRVGALFALRAGFKQGMNVDDALACGDSRGLTAPALREMVRAKLRSPE